MFVRLIACGNWIERPKTMSTEGVPLVSAKNGNIEFGFNLKKKRI